MYLKDITYAVARNNSNKCENYNSKLSGFALDCHRMILSFVFSNKTYV